MAAHSPLQGKHVVPMVVVQMRLPRRGKGQHKLSVLAPFFGLKAQTDSFLEVVTKPGMLSWDQIIYFDISGLLSFILQDKVVDKFPPTEWLWPLCIPPQRKVVTSYFRIPPLQFAAELQNWVCSGFALTHQVSGENALVGLYFPGSVFALQHQHWS